MGSFETASSAAFRTLNGVRAHALQDGEDDALLLAQQGCDQVIGGDLRVGLRLRRLDGAVDGFLGLLGPAVGVEGHEPRLRGRTKVDNMRIRFSGASPLRQGGRWGPAPPGADRLVSAAEEGRPMGHVGDGDDARLRRELVEETLEECERLLEAAQAAAAEIRAVAQRHALERGDGAARALTVAAERLRRDAASDRDAAREARELAERELAAANEARAEIDAELHAATAALDVARHEAQRLMAEATSEAEAHLRDAASARAALLAAANDAVTALQAEVLAELDDEAEARLARLDHELSARIEAATREEDARRRAADEAAAAVVAEGQRAADAAVRQADLIATDRVADADRTAEERLADADRTAEERLADADRTAEERLADADRTAEERLADADRTAEERLADADRAGSALIEGAQRQAADLVAEAEQRVDAIVEAAGRDDAMRAARVAEEAAAAERLASIERDAAAASLDRGHDQGSEPLLTAYQEARRIIAEAEAEAAAIRRAAQPTQRPPDDEPDDDTPPGSQAVGERRRRPRWVRNLRLLVVLLLALAGTELLRTHVAEPYTVAKTSMEPHINDGDRLFVNKLAYRTGDPSRGDVVVFDTTEVPGSADARGTTLVKRVVGLPGEVIQALDGDVVVDGEVVDDPWSDGKPTSEFGPIRVPDGTVFVLGDNRGLSVDSRTFGAVPIDSVIGRVEAIIWPPSDAGRV